MLVEDTPAQATVPALVPPAVRVEHLRKSYGTRLAIEDLSFEVYEGEVFALLGPNGAGKTTTIEILEGYRRRDAGDVRVLGYDPGREPGRLRRCVGLMLQEGGVYPQARPREILSLFAAFYPEADDPDELLELVGLTDAVKTTYRRLSGGQKQRLALALALVGRPRLVFLDEPTAGMDPQARHATWDIISSLRRRHVTVILTTHYMDEAEQLADRIGIMDLGRMVDVGDLESLRGGDETTVRLTLRGTPDLAELAGLPGVRAARLEQPGVYVFETPDPIALLAELTAWAARRGILLRELRVGGESLEEIFLRLTGSQMRG
ncbi:MAG: ABC transporter ATP-binding protein [Chloroflexota bacterium]